MPPLPPHEIYAAKLAHLSLGYALFEPDPNRTYDRVRVGDVGYISDGKFIRLFNAFNPMDTPENEAADFPNNFEPIAARFRRLDNLGTLTHGKRLSESVRAINIDVDGEESGLTSHLPVSVGAKVKFTCTTRSGAALITKHEATRQRALALRAMEEYMIKYCHSWLQLVNDLGRRVEMHDIIFVSQCILTGDWATTTWDKSSCEPEISFHVGISSVADVAFSVWGRWEDHVSVPKRRGPLRSDFTYSLSNFDQCIFLKGMRIALRDWYKKLSYFLKVKATDAGEDLTKPSRLPTVRRLRNYVCRVETVGSIDSSFRPVQNAYDILAIVIFEESDADLVVIDDDDLFSLQINTIGTLEEICDALLENRDLAISVFVTQGSDSHKVGKICRIAPEPSILTTQKSLDNLVLLDENFEQLHSDIESNYSASEDISYSHSGGDSELDLKVVSTKSVDPTQSFEGLAIPNTNVLHLQSDPLYPGSQFDLSLALYNRFQQSGEQEYLDESIACGRTALQLCPEDHPDRSRSLDNLAVSLKSRFEQNGRMEDLEESIVLGRAALVLCPPGHPDRCAALENLAYSFRARFDRSGQVEDLEECILLYREALVLRPPGHPDRFISLATLADSLRARFDGSGQVEDLDECTVLHRETLVLCPPGHPDRCAALVNLAYSLRARFDGSGQAEDLDECTVLYREALVLRPPGHPDHCAALENLAYSLRAQFDRSGQAEDLEECILLYREALVLRPPGHPDRSKLLDNLAYSLRARFDRSGQAEDLEECILLYREALVLRPPGHPDRCAALANLAYSLRARFDRSGQAEDLDERIALHREALVLRPEGHPDRCTALANLADSLRARFNRIREAGDLDECITLLSAALALRPKDHPDRHTALRNLENSLRARIQESGRGDDLDESTSLYRAVLKLYPKSHPDRSDLLKNLEEM